MDILRKLTVIIFLFVLFSSCNSSSQKNTDLKDEGVIDANKNHTALNYLDWQGEYFGVVPCADCEGLETTLILNEPNSYVLNLKYLGKSDSIYSSEGTFKWHKDGMRISLENEKNSISSYLVGENQVFLLDKKGAKIKDDVEEYYDLSRQ